MEAKVFPPHTYRASPVWQVRCRVQREGHIGVHVAQQQRETGTQRTLIQGTLASGKRALHEAGLSKATRLQSAEMDEGDGGRPSRQWEQRPRGEKAQPRACAEEGELALYLAGTGQGSSKHEAAEPGDQRPPAQGFGFYQRAAGHPWQVLRRDMVRLVFDKIPLATDEEEGPE